MNYCPVCKSKIKELYDYDAYNYYCSFDRKHFHEVIGISHRITINSKTMWEIYEGSVRHCRIQNRIADRWKKQGRKQWLKKNK